MEKLLTGKKINFIQMIRHADIRRHEIDKNSCTKRKFNIIKENNNLVK